MAASRTYVLFAGLAEVLGGALLFVPRLATLGALICAANLTNVLMLNSYDVPVKLYSFHLLLKAVFLLAPDVPRLAALLMFNRRVDPGRPQRLFAMTRSIAAGAGDIQSSLSARRRNSSGTERTPRDPDP
jgi:hypothetical protein